MKTQIVTEVVSIKGINEIKHFEIRIPENTNQLIGINFSVRFNDKISIDDMVRVGFEFIDQVAIADIRLQGAKHQTWFYAESIMDSLNINDGFKFYFENVDMTVPFIFHRKHETEKLHILPTTTRIKGFIKDVIGNHLHRAVSYTITICLHLELTN